jgi:hypothetical protein
MMQIKNVFVLSPGRSGSKSFVEATSHLSNYSSAHESRAALLGDERFNYPKFHIEADNRLCWFLGEMSKRYSGDEVLYVHLKRDLELTIDSFLHRLRNSNYRSSIINAFAHGILMKPKDWSPAEEEDVVKFYVETIHSNISEFVKSKNHLVVHLQDDGSSFDNFLSTIAGEGDLKTVRETWKQVHNSR